jgi:cell wall-associated NlpC family hydrolase
MAGRHRKPTTSRVTVAKIAVAGAVVGGSSLALTGQAGAASDSGWDQVARPLADTAARDVPSQAPEPTDALLETPEPTGPAPIDAPPADATGPQVPIEESYAAITPPPEQAIVVDSPPQPAAPADAPIAVAEPGDSDVAPAAEIQPEMWAPEATPPSPAPESDPALPPAPEPDSPATEDAPVPAPATDPRQGEFMTLIHQVSGTPYISGGDSASGTDCSGLASWLSNEATGRPVFGDRFATSNEESALLARGFRYGTAPGALVIGWNNRHTAVTLPDGTPVSSGEGGGVKVGGGGAYEAQFSHHMFLPIAPEQVGIDPAAVDAPTVVAAANIQVPAPAPDSEPADEGGNRSV